MFQLKPNSGIGNCFYLSVIDSIKNKHLTVRFLRLMDKKRLTVRNLRHFMAEQSEPITHTVISFILDLPTKYQFSEEITKELCAYARQMDPEMIQKKLKSSKRVTGLPFTREASKYIYSHIFWDKKRDKETKRTQFVEFYKQYIKTTNKWVCFVEVFLFRIMYADFIQREFNVEAEVVLTDGAPEFIFQYNADLYLNYENFHYEAWVFTKKRKKYIW